LLYKSLTAERGSQNTARTHIFALAVSDDIVVDVLSLRSLSTHVCLSIYLPHHCYSLTHSLNISVRH